jgi:hypothetical protein
MLNTSLKRLAFNTCEVVLKNSNLQAASSFSGLKRFNNYSTQASDDVNFYEMVELFYDRASAIVENKLVEEKKNRN